MEKREPFITIYESIGGWKAVMMWWNDEEKDLGGFWEPYQTGAYGYADRRDAIIDALGWADAEGLEYRPPGK